MNPYRETVPAGTEKQRVDRFLALRIPGATREAIKRWMGEGRVLLNGLPCRPSDQVTPGALLEVEPGPRPESDARPDEGVRFGVLYEDEALIVVDKPAGLVVHPARGHRDGTLVNGLLARPGFQRAPADPRDPAGHERPGIVHRIDRDTSGILVVAKTEEAREALKQQLAAHTMERVYEAITVGVPKACRIETLHGRDPKHRLRFSSRVTEGKRAVTHVEVLEVLGGGRAAHVRCVLETGRTHQIRVHLSEVTNTPLLADELYGGLRGAPEVVSVAKALGRHALHARVLGFVHPVTAERLRFEVPLPAELEQALSALR